METGKEVLEELNQLIEEEFQTLTGKNSSMLTIMKYEKLWIHIIKISKN